MYLVIICLICCLLFFLLKWNKIENFQWDPIWFGKTSSDCYDETARDCMKYSNCGLCYKNGIKTCIPGDSYGPFFKDNCSNWEYMNYYDEHIFNDKINSITLPWNTRYPIYEIYYPSREFISAL